MYVTFAIWLVRLPVQPDRRLAAADACRPSWQFTAGSSGWQHGPPRRIVLDRV